MKKLAYLFIILSGLFWGSMGIFVRRFNALGLKSMEIVFLRALVTTGVLFFFLLFFDRKMFIIRIKDLWCFLGSGIASITFFNFCYFNAMKFGSLSMAAILLYTAPAIVMLLSVVLFNEKLTLVKSGSLVVTFIGCGLVTGAFSKGQDVVLEGVLYGLGAGIGYALYSIFSRYAIIRKYNSLTITFYTFLITTISSMFIVDINKVRSIAFSGFSMSLFSVSFGLMCTVAPFLLYTIGLKYIENSKASILASVEPVFASIIGTLVFKEKLSTSGMIGIVLVIAAIVACAVDDSEKRLET